MVSLAFSLGGIPDVQDGSYRTFIVMRRREGKDFVFTAHYLKSFPLEYDECKCKEEHDDGCPTTGWFYEESNFDYESCFWPIGDFELIVFAPLPTSDDVKAAIARAEGRTP